MERLLEAERWMKQALRDLDAARNSVTSGNFEWACFQAQQATKKAVKALIYGLGRGAWGHSVLELLEGIRDVYGDVDAMLSCARELDRHYIPSRYPNAYESGYPALFYDEETAGRAIKCAEEIVKWVREKLGELGLEI